MVLRTRGNRDNKQGGFRPKLEVMPVDFDQDRPDDYPTIAAYLQSQGHVKHLTYTQQLKARRMFIQGKSIPEIVQQTDLEPHMIDRLSVINGWEEERDKRLLASFQKINSLTRRLSPDVDERHDRIAGSIESAAERLLHAHQDGQCSMDPADIKRIADILKTTVDIRRTIRGQKGSTHETKHVHELQLPDDVEAEKLATALSAVINNKAPARLASSPRRLDVSIGDGIGSDQEFES